MSGPSPQIIGDLAQRVRATRPKARRKLIAIAGPPASGKSTLAADLVAVLGDTCALVAMDGYHLDNRILESRSLLARKGAPETFDGLGFVQMIRRLSSEPEVVIPVFDRVRDIAIAGAQSIGPHIDTAIVEGNYLLLNTAPWRDLSAFWDLTVRLDVPEETLTARLIQRWLDHGHSASEAETRARANDLVNAQTVIRNSVSPDFAIKA